MKDPHHGTIFLIICLTFLAIAVVGTVIEAKAKVQAACLAHHSVQECRQ